MLGVVFLAGCSSAGRTAHEAGGADERLAATVVYVYGNEREGQMNRLVRPGTVVLWLNKSGNDIRIVFPERKVTIACLNPVSFNVNAEGVYESRDLAPGAVASLCFIQPGLYAYAVEFPAGGQSGGGRLEGTIVVQ
jgi:hypothetical protein